MSNPVSTTTNRPSAGKTERQLVRERDRLAAKTGPAVPEGTPAPSTAVREGGGPNSPPVRETNVPDFVAQAKAAAAVTAVDKVPVPPAVAEAAMEQILRNKSHSISVGDAAEQAAAGHRSHRSSKHHHRSSVTPGSDAATSVAVATAAAAAASAAAPTAGVTSSAATAEGERKSHSSRSSKHHHHRSSKTTPAGEEVEGGGSGSAADGGGNGAVSGGITTTSGAEGGDDEGASSSARPVVMRNRLKALREQEEEQQQQQERQGAAVAAVVSAHQLPQQQPEPSSPTEHARSSGPPTPHGGATAAAAACSNGSVPEKRHHRSHRSSHLEGDTTGVGVSSAAAIAVEQAADPEADRKSSGRAHRSHRAHRKEEPSPEPSQQQQQQVAARGVPSASEIVQADELLSSPEQQEQQQQSRQPSSAISAPIRPELQNQQVSAAASSAELPAASPAAAAVAVPVITSSRQRDRDSGHHHHHHHHHENDYTTSDSDSIFPSGSGLDAKRAQFLMAQLRGIQAELHNTLYDTSSGPDEDYETGDERSKSAQHNAPEFFHQAPLQYYRRQQQPQQQQRQTFGFTSDGRRVVLPEDSSGNECSTNRSFSGELNHLLTPEKRNQQLLEQQYRFLMGITPETNANSTPSNAAAAASMFVSPVPPSRISDGVSFSPNEHSIAAKIDPSYFVRQHVQPDYKLRPVGPERRKELLNAQKIELRAKVSDIRRSYQVEEFRGQLSMKKDPRLEASPLRDMELKRAISPQRILSARLAAERTLNVAVRDRERRRKDLLRAIMEVDGKGDPSNLRSLLALHLAA